jgi:mono/diheme cytochrome c family protein
MCEGAFGERLDTNRGIVLAHPVVDRKAQQYPQFFQDVVGRAGRPAAPGHDRADVLALHLADEPVTDVFVSDEALNHQLVRRNRGFPGGAATRSIVDRCSGRTAAVRRSRGAQLEETRRHVDQGKQLVEKNCSACHAVGATGASPNKKAPEFRTLHARHPNLALREPLSRGIAAPHDEMPKFTLAGPEIDAIVAHINNLSSAARRVAIAEAADSGNARKGLAYPSSQLWCVWGGVCQS